MRDAAFIFGCLIRRGRAFITLLTLFFKAALNSASPISIEYLGAREEVKRLTH